MFKTFSSAAMLAASATVQAESDNCCTLYGGADFSKDSVTLCYSSMEDPSYFNLEDISFGSIASYVCGDETSYSFCDFKGFGFCTRGDGRVAKEDAYLDKRINWVTLESYDSKANLSLASVAAKSDSLFKKLNLISSNINTSSLPEDASSHWYAGLLYAYTYQEVDERDYILECSSQRDELDTKLISAYNAYND